MVVDADFFSGNARVMVAKYAEGVAFWIEWPDEEALTLDAVVGGN
jgi:hypothetical protein